MKEKEDMLMEPENQEEAIETIATNDIPEAEVTPEESIEGEMQEPEAPVHRFATIISEEYPDREFAAPEDYDNALEEMLTALVSFRKKSTDANRILSELFDANPELGLVIKDMMDGATIREALGRHFDKDDLIPVEGDPDYEGWNKNKSERISKLEQRKQRDEEFNKNLEFSAAAIKEFAKENNMTDEQAATFLAPFDEMLAEINSGKMTKDALYKLKKIVDYEDAVTKAKEEGLMAGRNENITAKREGLPKGDGLPHISGAGSMKEQAKPGWIDGVVDHANKNRVL